MSRISLDMEQMKRLSDKNRRVYSARERMHEDEEEEKVCLYILNYFVKEIMIIILP